MPQRTLTINCYRGLGEDELEGTWRSRIVERYPKTSHWLDYYVWARRTGSPDAERLLQIVDPIVTQGAPRFDDASQYMFGLFYQLSKRPKEALAAYRKGANGRQDVRGICFDSLWAAAVAGELDETAVRDEALERVAKLADPTVAPFRRVAEWLEARWQLKENEQPDLEAAGQIAAAAEAKDRVGVNCFIGRALELRGDFNAAVEFYQAAVAEPVGRPSATYAFVLAVLRDHGIEPGTGAPQADEASAKEPADAK